MKVFPRRRGAVLVNSALGVALLGAAALAYTTLDDGAARQTAKAPVRTATVTRGTVLATVSGTGTLASPTDAAQDFATGGRLTAVSVAVGDTVTKGQVLATVDTTAAQQQVDAAQSALTTADANLTKARAGVTTTTVQQLPVKAAAAGSGSSAGSAGGGSAGGGAGGRGAGGSSASAPQADPSAQASPSAQAAVQAPQAAVPEPQTTTISTTKVDAAAVAQAEQQLATARTNLANAQAALAGTTLTASVDGTVASVSAKAGDTVGATGSGSTAAKSASSGTSAPSGFIVLTNPTGMQVTANFSELDSLKLKKGEAATVTLNAQSDTKLGATVLAVSPLPVSGSGGGSAAVQYAATLGITGDTSKLRTGLSATVSVVTGEAADALSLPTAALSGTGADRTATLVHPDGATERITVGVGVEGDTTVQVVSGLSEGDQVELASTSGSNGFPNGSFPGAGGGQGGRNGAGAGAGAGAGGAGAGVAGVGGAAGGAGTGRGGGR
ncbi:efflux RND transporter periplasmic adaptor subunit [Kitasatospora sp. NPDC058201]|uniref:efflux RND transporter periplasmic adaptor subunit n=1 Tax=unclassified Kitasatospora TaxID=2633591 RepID=UPI0036571D24